MMSRLNSLSSKYKIKSTYFILPFLNEEKKNNKNY